MPFLPKIIRHSKHITLSVLLCFFASKAIMPPGFMFGKGPDSNFLVICTADGISKKYFSLSDAGNAPYLAIAAAAEEHSDTNDNHISALCHFSSANHAGIIASSILLPPNSSDITLWPSIPAYNHELAKRKQNRPRAPPLYA